MLVCLRSDVLLRKHLLLKTDSEWTVVDADGSRYDNDRQYIDDDDEGDPRGVGGGQERRGDARECPIQPSAISN